MRGTGELLLYLGFDGVLHDERCCLHPHSRAFLKAPVGHRLFQHAHLLDAELEAFPDLRIVLSTSWQLRYGLKRCVNLLPYGLAIRCSGGTFHSRSVQATDFLLLPRGVQVQRDVDCRMPRAWVALDDSVDGWSSSSNWIRTDPVDGLAADGVLGRLQEKLLDMHLGEQP